MQPHRSILPQSYSWWIIMYRWAPATVFIRSAIRWRGANKGKSFRRCTMRMSCAYTLRIFMLIWFTFREKSFHFRTDLCISLIKRNRWPSSILQNLCLICTSQICEIFDLIHDIHDRFSSNVLRSPILFSMRWVYILIILVSHQLIWEVFNRMPLTFKLILTIVKVIFQTDHSWAILGCVLPFYTKILPKSLVILVTPRRFTLMFLLSKTNSTHSKISVREFDLHATSNWTDFESI